MLNKKILVQYLGVAKRSRVVTPDLVISNSMLNEFVTFVKGLMLVFPNPDVSVI